MTIQDGDTKFVCHECIGDEFLSDEVKNQVVSSLCSYCDEERPAMTLEAIADRVEIAISEHYDLTPDHPTEPEEFVILAISREWDRKGELVEWVIAEMAGVEEKIARDVQELLNMKSYYPAVRDGDEAPFGYEAMYEEKGANVLGFKYTWNEFRRDIRSRARFFNTAAEENLGYIFGDLTALESYDGRAVIREISPEAEDRFIWRARQAYSDKELEAILKLPAQEIGRPPSSLAKSGRMNAHGIPVFYGALGEDTCVSEVRPPVGSSVVVGKFEVLKPLKLLDLGVLAQVVAKGSYFDPGYVGRKNRAAFLQQLVDEISRPVMPGDEQLEYIATQVVAEYLSRKSELRLDGIIFPSSQTGGDGRNVVLFNHASRAEPYNLPDGTVSWMSPPSDDEEYGDSDVYVFEDVPNVQPDTDPSVGISRKSRGGAVIFGFDSEESDTEPSVEPTLRLDLDSVVVLKIKGVSYSYSTHAVKRHRDTGQAQSFSHLIEDLPFG